MRRSIPKARPYAKCPVEQTLDVIGGRWKSILLFHLFRAPVLRFGELRRKLSQATPRMLTLQLRELERDGCVERTVYPEVPPRVEYRITPFGRTLMPVVPQRSVIVGRKRLPSTATVWQPHFSRGMPSTWGRGATRLWRDRREARFGAR